MGVPEPASFDPIAQTVFGLFGESVDNPDINGVAVVTFGFVYATGSWFNCDPTHTTSWASGAPGVSTSWSAATGVSTGWTICGPYD